jgi:hypothetical protein
VHDRGRPAGGRLDERAQPTRGGDAVGERQPDRERDGEDDERERDDEAGRAISATCNSRQERQECERPADRRDREPEQEVSREAGASRLVGARPRDGSAPAASGADAGNIEAFAHAFHTRAGANRFQAAAVSAAA